MLEALLVAWAIVATLGATNAPEEVVVLEVLKAHGVPKIVLEAWKPVQATIETPMST